MREKTFVLAPDSFKESMTAKEVCLAMESGLRKIYPEAAYIHVPMADGGEGTVQSLVDASGGEIHYKKSWGLWDSRLQRNTEFLATERLRRSKWLLPAAFSWWTRQTGIR